MRPFPYFTLHRPDTLKDALRLLSELESPIPIAGGTDLLINLREGTRIAKHIVDLGLIKELRYIQEVNNVIHIGSTTTLAQIVESELIKEKAHTLYDAVSRIGSPQIRNLATIAGNLCNASPAADSAPPLLVLNAEVIIKSADDTKLIPINGLFAGPKINSLAPNELVTEIRFPVSLTNSGSAFQKIGRREAFTLSIVTAAAYIELKEKICNEVRVAFGSVAETPIRVEPVEKLIMGRMLTQDLMEKACEMSKRHVQPITDIRATAEYRRDMCAILFKRVMERSLQIARSQR